ncbi:MAG: PHP domain-containing protein [Erysipelotrichales bacterium]|nr:MAG: PHP domain-containing protein [Erysipelotrichales bacterium]
MFYDLHIHSALSPCADDDMRPTNIVRMALLNGLELISVTDHNSIDNQAAIAYAAQRYGIAYWYGVELQTREEVHILGYFKTIDELEHFDRWLQKKRDKTPNRPDLFGNQYILDEQDEIMGVQTDSLIRSLDANLDECINAIRSANGKIVLAHVMDRKNGILNQLAFIPKKLDYDGIEITDSKQRDLLIQQFPWLNDKPFFVNSDAHTLVSIKEAAYEISADGIVGFWRTKT